MRTFDLTPLYRSTVGFDRLFSMLDQGLDGAAPGYPPYNIERTGENEYRVTVAVAGFDEPELSVVAKENTLTIRGEKNAKEEEKRGDVLYQGIAARTFERVSSSPTSSRSRAPSLENGLLHVDLVREIPEAKKPRTIPIGNGNAAVEHQRGGLSGSGFEIRCNAAPRFSGALFVGCRLRRSSREVQPRSGAHAAVGGTASRGSSVVQRNGRRSARSHRRGARGRMHSADIAPVLSAWPASSAGRCDAQRVRTGTRKRRREQRMDRGAAHERGHRRGRRSHRLAPFRDHSRRGTRKERPFRSAGHRNRGRRRSG